MSSQGIRIPTAPVPFDWLNPEPGAARPMFPMGPPADFGGAIIPNPDNIQALPDTQAPGARLDGGTLSTQNFRGKTPIKTVSDSALPPLPAGYQLDSQSATPPLPKGYALDRPAAAPTKDDKEGLTGALGSDLWNMLPHSASEAAQGVWKRLLSTGTMGVSDLPQFITSVKSRLDKGRSVPYALGAAEAEGTGSNVSGMEDAADKGDAMGVLGHALGVPVVMAAGAGLAKGADVASHPAFQKALASVAETVKPAVRAAAKAGSDIVDPELTGVVSPRLAHAQRVLGRVANALSDKPQSDGAPIERDATKDNVPYAGELNDMTDRLADEIAKRKGAPQFTDADRLKAKSLLEDSLKSSTGDVIDQIVPGKNTAVKSRVDFYLKKADVAGAESELDKGAKAWKNLGFDQAASKQASAESAAGSLPEGMSLVQRAQQIKEQLMSAAGTNKPAWTALDRQPVPSTNEIRARVQREAAAPKAGTRADLMDDKAVDQQWQWHLDRHGWAAESEARREFIARNSTGMTKGELAKRFAAGQSGSAAGTASQPASASGAAGGDLVDILQKSLEQARKPKAQQ